jgi:soluble calcium-activated nucleotidase 1
MDTTAKISLKKKAAWMSIYKTLLISRRDDGKYELERLLEEVPIVSRLSEGDRGMELSELLYFHGKLLALSDRTGVIYEVLNGKLVPLWILADGDGNSESGFKSEWATVVDDHLYVGSTGKPWVSKNGEEQNSNRLWVKRVSSTGVVEHLSWHHVYKKIQNVTNTLDGFVVHEAVVFNPLDRRWYFLPRRMSHRAWSKKEGKKGNFLLISCDEHFENWKTLELGKEHKGHGYSSFKFVPFREGEIIALKTEETGDHVHTDLEVIDVVTGKILLFVNLGKTKYEGVEIIPSPPADSSKKP